MPTKSNAKRPAIVSIARETTPEVQTPQKQDAVLSKLVESLNKKFGTNAVTLGFPKDSEGIMKTFDRIPTGSVSLDIALGGGMPLGRFIEISGDYSSTKTVQCLHIVRNAQKAGYRCAFIDVEGTTDEKFVKDLGIDYSSLLYCNPSSMEETLQILVDLQKSGEVHLAILDSMAACMATDKELASEMDETTRMGVPQQLFGEYFRKFQMMNNRLSREGKRTFTVIGTNQLREKIGAYGDPEYSPGGRSKGFAASVDIRLRRGDWIQEGKGDNREFVGQVVKFKISKNKTFKRMQTGEFDFYFTEANSAGVPVFYNDNAKEIIVSGVEWGLIKQAGSWFTYAEERYQGMTSLVEALRDNSDLTEKLKKEIMFLATAK